MREEGRGNGEQGLTGSRAVAGPGPPTGTGPAAAASSPFPRPPSLTFRLLDTAPAPGAWNMALDDVLMAGVGEGGAPALRFYRWSPRCLSLGRNQPAHGRYDEELLRRRGIDAVRRRTGGRAVLHDRELTYSVVVPSGLLGGPRETYHAVNRALVAGLRSLGVEAGLQPRTQRRAPVPSLAPCFREPAEGEVVVRGRKLVGSALCQERGVILQHGSLLLEGGQAELGVLLGGAPSAREDEPAVLSDLLPRLPAWPELVEALAQGWTQALGVPLRPDGLTPPESEKAELRRRHYADPAWTWRR